MSSLSTTSRCCLNLPRLSLYLDWELVAGRADMLVDDNACASSLSLTRVDFNCFELILIL
jgi:hypothetical protein